MEIHLSNEQWTILRHVAKKYCPELLSRMATPQRAKLTPEERYTLCQLLSDELCSTGLNEDSEANERGLALEDLIDVLRETRGRP